MSASDEEYESSVSPEPIRDKEDNQKYENDNVIVQKDTDNEWSDELNSGESEGAEDGSSEWLERERCARC